MNKQVKVLLLSVLAIVAISTMGVSGCVPCVPCVNDPDLIGAWRYDWGGGCYQDLTFIDSGTVVGVFEEVTPCGVDWNPVDAIYTVNTSVTPHQIDIYESEHHYLGVYQVDGDVLRIAGNEAPDPRPTDVSADHPYARLPFDPDLRGAWRRDRGEGCYEYHIFTDAGMDVSQYGTSACGDNNGRAFVSTYTVDTSVTPHQMDVYDDQGDHLLIIYEVNGDTLEAAVSEAPNPRPTDFTESEYVEIVEFERLP